MPPVVQVGAPILCPHGGMVNIIPGQARVLVSGAPAATLTDVSLVAGCVFVIPPGKPQPCVRVQWLMGATRVLVMGKPALLMTSAGLASSVEQIPGGPPIITFAQPRVMAL